MEFGQAFAYREVIKNLVLRDLKVRYKRSILGFLWVMLNPLLIMTVLYVVFSQVFHSLPNYAAYLISGIVLWNMFSYSTSTATYSFLSNGNLLKKIAIPKMIFPIASVASALINFCFSLIPLLIILLLTGASLNTRVLLIPACVFELLVFTIGIALILSTAVVFFHDIIYIYEVILLAWMYFSPIFYPVSILPAFITRMMRFNPLYHYLSIFRGLLYDATIGVDAIGTHLVYGFLFALLSFVLGVWMYAANRKRLVFYL